MSVPYVCRTDMEMPPRYLESSKGTYGDERPVTVFERFMACATQHAAFPALAYKRPAQVRLKA